MPIEIRELHIRVAVDEKPGPGGTSGKGGGATGGKDEIIAECVEEVMRILAAERRR